MRRCLPVTVLLCATVHCVSGEVVNRCRVLHSLLGFDITNTQFTCYTLF